MYRMEEEEEEVYTEWYIEYSNSRMGCGHEI